MQRFLQARHFSSSAVTGGAYRPLRGMHDAFGAAGRRRQRLVQVFSLTAETFGYGPIETPILEATDVFTRPLGIGSDVVTKEMYSFTPEAHAGEGSGAHAAAAGEGSITLRPEGTAGVMRAIVSNNLVRSLPQRVYYHGPMFRHERPQKGRYRQFYQLGVEAVGPRPAASAAAGESDDSSGAGGSDASVATDLESLHMAHAFLRAALAPAGDAVSTTLVLNTLGDAESMAAHSSALKAHFEAGKAHLSPDSLARLARGAVLRILDSKAPADAPLIASAPGVQDFLSPAAGKRFTALRRGLDALGIAYELRPSLVRGLDYYRHTVFEFEARVGGGPGEGKGEGKGQAGTILAGGRYDGLLGMFGGPSDVPGIGWAAGLERLELLLEAGEEAAAAAKAEAATPAAGLDIAVLPVVTRGEGADAAANAAVVDAAAAVAAALRERRLEAALAAGSSCSSAKLVGLLAPGHNLKKMMGAASKSSSRLVLIVGEAELAAGAVRVKDMGTGAQALVALPPEVAQRIGGRCKADIKAPPPVEAIASPPITYEAAEAAFAL